ncbi:hypothetical protein [Bacillus sp. REN3]|uniref:hypothetical protein n=1 Tax=Bacillus sp. REN3 TaxID=2802440 RepID=UPI001AEE3A54|nr:hypothetical protein [Bacillus sp. REN3]
MKKVSILFMIILAALLIVILVWQWATFLSREALTKRTAANTIIQNITITADEQGLKVKQVFQGLEERSYEAAFPGQASNLECKDATGAPCRKAERKNHYFGLDGQLQFNYYIKGDFQSKSTLIDGWMVILADTFVSGTKLKVVDQRNRQGMWVAGLPLKGHKQMEFVDYYVFEGTTPNPALYWHNKKLINIPTKKGISYYADKKSSNSSFQTKTLDCLRQNGHVSVVVTNQKQNERGPGMVIAAGNTPKDRLEHELAAAFLELKLPPLAQSEKWMADALASLAVSHPASTQKGRDLTAELKRKVSASDLSDFLVFLEKSPSLQDFEQLDEHLGKLNGLNTDFFMINRREDSPLSPLIFTETRSLFINENKISNPEIIVEDGKRFYPFLETMGFLGFVATYEPSKDIVKVTSFKKKFIFNSKDATFDLNGKKYGLLSKPFILKKEILYMEEAVMESIFGISVIEDDQEIRISA